MLHDHTHDLSIGTYIVIALALIGHETIGLELTARLGLCVGVIAIVAALATAAIMALVRAWQRQSATAPGALVCDSATARNVR